MKSISLLHIMNRITKYLFGSVALFSMSACNNSYVQPDAQIKEVPFTQVHLDDNFWTPRIETNRTVSIPSAFKECEKNGRFDNFAIAGGLMKGEHRGDFSFDDTDPYKIIEGASYSLAVKYDKALDAYLDSVITLIATAQEPDGYLTTCVTNNAIAFPVGGERVVGKRLIVMNFIIAVICMKLPLLIIVQQGSVISLMWLSRMPTWYVRSLVRMKDRSMFLPGILSLKWPLLSYIR